MVRMAQWGIAYETHLLMTTLMFLDTPKKVHFLKSLLLKKTELYTNSDTEACCISLSHHISFLSPDMYLSLAKSLAWGGGLGGVELMLNPHLQNNLLLHSFSCQSAKENFRKQSLS